MKYLKNYIRYKLKLEYQTERKLITYINMEKNIIGKKQELIKKSYNKF